MNFREVMVTKDGRVVKKSSHLFFLLGRAKGVDAQEKRRKCYKTSKRTEHTVASLSNRYATGKGWSSSGDNGCEKVLVGSTKDIATAGMRYKPM